MLVFPGLPGWQPASPGCFCCFSSFALQGQAFFAGLGHLDEQERGDQLDGGHGQGGQDLFAQEEVLVPHHLTELADQSVDGVLREKRIVKFRSRPASNCV